VVRVHGIQQAGDFDMGNTSYRPFPENAARRELANERRSVASRASGKYAPRSTERNDDEDRLEQEKYPASFTKGLPHDEFGMLEEPAAYDRLVKEINQQDATDFGAVPRGIGEAPGSGSGARIAHTTQKDDGKPRWRGWESPRAGHYFDLQGPDADAVGMPPAPALQSDELIAEMGEVYALALLRDVPFDEIASRGETPDPTTGISPREVMDALARLSWFTDTSAGGLSLQERRRRAARRTDHGPDFPIDDPPDDAAFDPAAAFRGSGPGNKVGPYVSQFMLLGNKLSPDSSADIANSRDITDSTISYGVQVIDQKIETFAPGQDFMLHWNAYVDVQNGADFSAANPRQSTRRFIATPRDLAAYVKFDALYQAYLNACLFMLSDGVPFQQPVTHRHTGKTGPGFPDSLAGEGEEPLSRQPFATFGGPHILSLVTEVATRCLKAVRRQKFNYHRRARPERIGALLTLQGTKGDPNAPSPENDKSDVLGTETANAMTLMLRNEHLGPLLALVDKHNQASAASADAHLDLAASADPAWFAAAKNYLLPMAFAEGSPMHPSYGAGHATVAGGCVTMLKAFFDTVGEDGEARPWGDRPVVRARNSVQVDAQTGEESVTSVLERLPADAGMTIAGELDKLAANISIGRNMAGVHYYTDYYESLRMGERVATGILIEQMKQYNEPVEMNFHSFDGDHVHILKLDHDYSEPRVLIHDSEGKDIAFDDWWTRHLPDGEQNATTLLASNASSGSNRAPGPASTGRGGSRAGGPVLEA